MKPRLRPWVKLPSAWIEKGGLPNFRWRKDGAANVAALMVLIAIAHRADDETGIARLTYDDLEAQTWLSRASIAAGLGVLERETLIEREPQGRSTFRLADYHRNAGWAKLPAAGLYFGDGIAAFEDFKLRRPVELDALKLYLLIAARRDRNANMALLTYDAIEERAGITRERIRHAITLLAAQQLIHIDHLPRQFGEPGVVRAYRLTHLDSYRHMGTTGRGLESADF